MALILNNFRINNCATGQTSQLSALLFWRYSPDCSKLRA